MSMIQFSYTGKPLYVFKRKNNLWIKRLERCFLTDTKWRKTAAKHALAHYRIHHRLRWRRNGFYDDGDCIAAAAVTVIIVTLALGDKITHTYSSKEIFFILENWVKVVRCTTVTSANIAVACPCSSCFGRPNIWLARIRLKPNRTRTALQTVRTTKSSTLTIIIVQVTCCPTVLISVSLRRRPDEQFINIL